MTAPILVTLCLVSASFYVAATLVLKFGSGLPFLLLLAPVFCALGLAAWFESLALPSARLGIVLLLILAFEVVLTAGVSFALGEAYRPSELLGMATILLGIVILFSAEEARSGG